MERPKFGARLALVSLAAIASLLVPATAGATSVPGPNGDLAFTSGRAPQADDAQARIWVVGPSGGTAIQETNVPPSSTGQHRQPNWSPDHAKIAYSISPSGEIRIRDLLADTDTQFVAAAAAQDRPTWSPDGTKIAYGAGGQIFVKGIAPGSIPQPITSGATDERPVWSPDGNTIYFNRLVAANDNDIFKKTPVTLGATATAVVTGTDNDWQTSVSPDGSKLCFTRGPKNSTAELWTASATSANTSVAVFANSSIGDINCVWSPDGTEIAYTQGTFGAGQLVAKSSSGSGPVRTISQDASTSVYFDGNADWATNFRPQCQDRNVNVGVNGFAKVSLPCTDQDSTDSDLEREIVNGPGHGNLGGIDDDDDSVIYTPNVNFSGNDSFTFNGSDGNSTSNAATVHITVSNASSSGKDTKAATIDKVSLSRRTWRRGTSLPGILARAGVGTTISYRLSEKARATLTFARKASGRKVGRSCRKPTRKNRTRRRCTRYVKAGTLQFDGKSGVNKVKFQGKLSRRKRLAVGRYRLIVGAKDAAGNVSKNSSPVFFKIVKR